MDYELTRVKMTGLAFLIGGVYFNVSLPHSYGKVLYALLLPDTPNNAASSSDVPENNS